MDRFGLNFSKQTLFAGLLMGVLLASCRNEASKPAANAVQQKSDLLAGQVKAVAYSGFRHGQHPDRGEGAVNPSDQDILEDLKILTRNNNFNLIRLYDAQQNSQDVLRVIHEHKLNVKVLLGIWLYAEVSNHQGCPWLNDPIPPETLAANKLKNRREIATAIQLARQYEDIIVAVNVGNEALVSWNDHMVTVDSVISYVRKVKRSISQLVTVADNYKWWAVSGAALAREVDFAGIQTYPLWEGKDINEGLAFTAATVQEVADSLPGVPIVLTEAGWATAATEFGPRASEEKQQRYFWELMDWAAKMNVTTFFFEAFDEDWKGDPGNPLGAEKHWGLFTVDRKPKLTMQDQYPDLMEN